ncbi:MAG: LTA synthase family protein [Oscillospiraceae bacterium]|nr:LTA synthase family protein [Oscillospiraceae bacterium]
MLLSYPQEWWLGLLGLICQGVLILRRFPRWGVGLPWKLLSAVLMAVLSLQALAMPETVFEQDEGVKYAGSDYGRSRSAEAAYDNMFNTHRLYQVCGLYQTLAKDIYANAIYPLTPAHALAQAQAEAEIDTWFQNREKPSQNAMTGLLEGKNVVLVLMESMDDWMIGEHTPTIGKLMSEGINFTNFYTPVYGGIRTFNTEFCINTGSFLSSQGGYAFDYVTNTFDQSLASRLRAEGYSAKTFHYNDPSFYSRGEFSPAMGYEEYVCYADHIEETDEKTVKNLLYDDNLLFDNEALNAEFFREGQPKLNFVITRSAHLSYKYNEVLSYWGLKKYPEYRGLTGNEETDCAYLKAKLVDDFFARLLEELEEKGQLNDTVIIGVTDHYTYGYKDLESLYTLSGVEEDLLLEKTPCFIWSANLEAMEVDKVLNTSDLLPTMLNLLGVESGYDYIGRDAFDDSYDGFVPFSNGSWIYGDMAYDAKTKSCHSVSGSQQLLTADFQQEMAKQVQSFVRVNNLILETDYYR